MAISMSGHVPYGAFEHFTFEKLERDYMQAKAAAEKPKRASSKTMPLPEEFSGPLIDPPVSLNVADSTEEILDWFEWAKTQWSGGKYTPKKKRKTSTTKKSDSAGAKKPKLDSDVTDLLWAYFYLHDFLWFHTNCCR